MCVNDDTTVVCTRQTRGVTERSVGRRVGGMRASKKRAESDEVTRRSKKRRRRTNDVKIETDGSAKHFTADGKRFFGAGPEISCEAEAAVKRGGWRWMSKKGQNKRTEKDRKPRKRRQKTSAKHEAGPRTNNKKETYI